MTDTNPPRQVLHLRVPDDLRAAVAQLAQRTERTLNGAAVYLIRLGLDAERGHSPAPLHS